MLDGNTQEPMEMWLLSDLHQERWALTAAKLDRRLKAAEGEEREEIERQLDAHYDTRFYPETSREAIMQQIKENARKRASEASDSSETGSGHSH